MKKATLVLSIAIALSSCKKKYICTCTISFAGNTSTTYAKYDETKSQAKSDCNSLNSTTNTQTVVCAIN